jgi:hypothetical protein
LSSKQSSFLSIPNPLANNSFSYQVRLNSLESLNMTWLECSLI